MTFARYKGGGGPGVFTKNKTYLVEQVGSDAVNLHRVTIEDDNGVRIIFSPDNDSRFVFCDEVWVCVLHGWSDINPGDILEACDISQDMKSLLVKWSWQERSSARMIDRDWFEIIDMTTLRPGMELKDTESGHWKRVESIDEQMRVNVLGEEGYETLDGYALSVTMGEIDRVRIVRCTMDAGIPELTKGKLYRVTHEGKEVFRVVADSGQELYFDKGRFSFS